MNKMEPETGRATLVATLTLLICSACGDATTSATTATGGATATGGNSVVGGALGAGGGSAMNGGAPTSGGANATGGAVSAGGAGKGGAATSGGTVSAGGAVSVGGKASGGSGNPSAGGKGNTGGSTLAGGSPSAGGNVAVGGRTGSGGQLGLGGRTGATSGGSKSSGGTSASGGVIGSAGTSASGGVIGSGGGGGCQKGTTKGNEVAVIGESFIAMTHGITQEIEKQAKAAGSLGANEKYVDNSVSGTTLANDQIPSQYRSAQASNNIRFVLMDGGGNDCLQRNDANGALTAAKSLFQTMTTDGVEAIVYFFYPDPIGSQYSTLKTCLDTLRPQMKALCDGLAAPRCYWLDLRTVWNGHNEYTSDGIHPTSAGSIATGDAIWEVMKANCVAQ